MTTPPLLTLRLKAINISFAILFAALLAIALMITTECNSLRMDSQSQQKEIQSLRAANQEMQSVLLRLTPQAGDGAAPLGLWQQDLQKDTGTLIETFRVVEGVHFGVVHKDRVTPALPVWFFEAKEVPEKGSPVSFLHYYLQLEGGQSVLVFSRFVPNL